MTKFSSPLHSSKTKKQSKGEYSSHLPVIFATSPGAAADDNDILREVDDAELFGPLLSAATDSGEAIQQTYSGDSGTSYHSAHQQEQEADGSSTIASGGTSSSTGGGKKNKKTSLKKKIKSPIKSTFKPLIKSFTKKYTKHGDNTSQNEQQDSSNDYDPSSNLILPLPTTNSTMPSKYPDYNNKNDEMVSFAQFDQAELGQNNNNYQSVAPQPHQSSTSPRNSSNARGILFSTDSKDENDDIDALLSRHQSSRSFHSTHSTQSSFLSNLKSNSLVTSLKKTFSNRNVPFGRLLRTSSTRKRSGSELWELVRSKLPDIVMMSEDITATGDGDDDDIGQSVSNDMDIKLSTCFMGILLYLGLGTFFYSYVFERWPIIDSLYFTVVTFTTVGYGDYTPQTHAARLFTSLFSFVGISSLGLALGVIGDKVLSMRLEAVTKELNDEHTNKVLEVFGFGSSSSGDGGNGSIRSISPKNSSNCVSPGFDGSGNAELLKVATTLQKSGEEGSSAVMKKVLYWAPIATLLFGGSAIIAWDEHWSWSQAIYFCTITTTTVGYGDFVPTSQRMRLLAVFYVPIAVGVMGSILGGVASYVMEEKRKAMMNKLKNRRLRIGDLLAMDENGDGHVSELEYLKFMLLKMQKVDQELLDELHSQFQHFDVDGSGMLAKSDLYVMAKQRSKELDNKLRLSGYKQRLLQLAKEAKANRRNANKKQKQNKQTTVTTTTTTSTNNNGEGRADTATSTNTTTSFDFATASASLLESKGLGKM